MRVYVVGFAPSDDRAATGGFDWYLTPEEAVRNAKRSLRDLGELGTHSVTFVPLEVPDAIAYPNGATVADRNAVTNWIVAHFELVEVGLPPAEEAEPSPPPRNLGSCVIYDCDNPALGRTMFALPNGAKALAPVCGVHRAILAAGAQSEAYRDEDRGHQTRPSAILRRPDPETPISEATNAELLFEVLERAKAMRDRESDLGGMARDAFAVAREYGFVIALVEDAITRNNKAVYLQRGIFAITDAERTTTD